MRTYTSDKRNLARLPKGMYDEYSKQTQEKSSNHPMDHVISFCSYDYGGFDQSVF
jgi:hypothetical protein